MTAPEQPAPSTPRFYINSWAARTGQRILARVVDSTTAIIVVLVVLAAGPHGRPVAQDLIIVALITAIEALSLSRNGTTLGMQTVGIRVATIGRSGPPDWLTACRRTVPVALCYPILLPGLFTVLLMPVALLISIGLSPQRRGFHDRLSHTVVVQRDAPARITEADLDLWWHVGRNVVMSPWGRVPGLYDRRRARTHRLDDTWWLAAVIAVGGIVAAGLRGTPWIWVWATAAWIIVVIIDETITVTNRGATPGHARCGYRIVDLSTGGHPTRARALARSIVLIPMLYVPPLQLLLALWVHSSSLHRGPHDLIAKTVVVDPDYEPPVFAAAPTPRVPAPWSIPAALQPTPWPHPPATQSAPPVPPGAPPPPSPPTVLPPPSHPGVLPPPPSPGPF